MHSSYAGLCLFILLTLQCSCRPTLGISSMRRKIKPFSPVQKEIQKDDHPCRLNMKDKSADCTLKDFGDIPQDLNSDLEILYLPFNNIRYLRNTSFQKYSHLTVLRLDSNYIFWIQEDSFYPLVHLIELNLSYNPGISSLPIGSFQAAGSCKVQLDFFGFFWNY